MSAPQCLFIETFGTDIFIFEKKEWSDKHAKSEYINRAGPRLTLKMLGMLDNENVHVEYHFSKGTRSRPGE